MSASEKENDSKETAGLNMKRAPSAGTVTNMDADNMWERSQSDANLSTHKGTSSEEKANVSDNSSVYWNLSCPDQGPVKRNPYMTASSISGFQMGLETIHQHDELNESNYSKESVSSNMGYESNSSFSNQECFPKSQVHNKNNSYTFMLASSECLSNPLLASPQNDKDSDMRKSCSAIPSAFISTYGSLRADNVINDNQISNECKQKDTKLNNPSLTIEIVSTNYFCESDFDDNREQIPNNQIDLKSLQDEMKSLIQSLEMNKSPVFEWGDLPCIDHKFKILSKCYQMIEQAWQTPNVGRDFATSLCNLIRQQGLLNYLVECVIHAGEVATVTEENPTKTDELTMMKRQFLLLTCEFFSQILITENLDYILGLSSENSTPNNNSQKDSMFENGTKPTHLFKEIVKQSLLVKSDKEINRQFIAILEAFLKHHEKTNRLVVQYGGLNSLIYSCRSTDSLTLRHVAFGLANISLFADSDILIAMVHNKVVDWLFPLAFNNDDIIKYYACLAIVIFSSHKEFTMIIQNSGTLQLVLSFINTHSPFKFAELEPSHFQGRSSKWLKRLLPLLESENVEAVSLASFHLVMEARIKQKQGKTEIFKDIGAIDIIKKVASSIYKIAAQFSRQILNILGEPLPFSLYHPVALWNCEDVLHWLDYIGFHFLSERIQDLKIDGDILFSIDESIMLKDLDIRNGIIRQRLLREINKLKGTTTYETCDPTGVYGWLKTEVGLEYCQYTYALIKAGIDRKFLLNLKNEMLEKDCLINNSVHRTRILNAIEDEKMRCMSDGRNRYRIDSSRLTNLSKDFEPKTFYNTQRSKPHPLSCDDTFISNYTNDSIVNDDKVVKNMDVFISYRRCNGSLLASLVRVHLKQRGYQVFLDIDRLPAGKFNHNLLKSIQISRNFILILSPNSLDKCLNDYDKKDWLHKEIVYALESKCNIIPITDKFVFPVEELLPKDMKSIVKYNSVVWVHNYQEACVDKIESFMNKPNVKSPFSPQQRSTSSITEQFLHYPDFLENFIID